MNQNISYTFPKWNVDSLVQAKAETRKKNWENDFDVNYQSFAKNVAVSIAKDVFVSIEHTLQDHYRESPNVKSTLSNEFSFEITNPNSAAELKTRAHDSAELPPFNEWFKKFSNPNQKISEDDNELSSISLSFSMRTKEKEKGIEKEYFQDMMSMIGHAVQTHLESIFKTFQLQEGNSHIQFKVTWRRKQEEYGSRKPSKDNHIQVETWIEESKQQQIQIVPTEANKRLELQRKTRERAIVIKNVMNVAKIVAVAVIAVFLFSLLPRPPQKA